MKHERENIIPLTLNKKGNNTVNPNHEFQVVDENSVVGNRQKFYGYKTAMYSTRKKLCGEAKLPLMRKSSIMDQKMVFKERN